MNDKERILMLILSRMSFTQTLCLRGNQEKQFADKDGQYVHFGCYDDRPVEKGDLVMAQTGSVGDWKIGWVHQVISFDTCVIREIGSDRLCNYSNERFVRIVGMEPSLLLEGEEYIFEQKVKAAFHKGDKYIYRFGGVDFKENNVAEIWIREVFGGFNPKNPSKPFSFTMKWTKRTTVKKILETMYAHGYGTREFEKGDNEPAPATQT